MDYNVVEVWSFLTYGLIESKFILLSTSLMHILCDL